MVGTRVALSSGSTESCCHEHLCVPLWAWLGISCGGYGRGGAPEGLSSTQESQAPFHLLHPNTVAPPNPFHSRLLVSDARLTSTELSPSLASAGFPTEARQHRQVLSYLYLPNSLVSILVPISLDVSSVCLFEASQFSSKKYLVYVYVCVPECMSVYPMNAGACRVQERPSDLLELELQDGC